MPAKLRLPLICLLIAITLNAAWAKPRLSDAQYDDKIRGAWLGKCIGGALGMPLESWGYAEIDKKFPKITGYTGYFREAKAGWSGIAATAQVPKDGEWHRLTLSATVPGYDFAKLFASPILGMSYEHSTAPFGIEIRNLRMLRPQGELALCADNWQPDSRCAWTSDGGIRFDYAGERAWIRPSLEKAKQLALKPEDPILFAFDAKWLSGDDRLGLAFDYYTRGISKGFGPDDDTSYQIVGLHALETFGPDLSCKQIAREWCGHLPRIDPGLAEGLALERMRKGILPPESGEIPSGEAIGGQMKGEIWGLVCPGRPDLAAEYARRDGVVAHRRNGVYGEQFVAAMISGAFEEKSPRKLIELGLGKIPADSQYARTVREVIAWHDRFPDWRDTRREVKAKYPGICDPVYAEAGIVTLALLYGEGDFEKTITIAASCGSDTDCNTATVGALLGCIGGAKAIPAKRKEPIGDDFTCFVIGMEKWKISELGRRIRAAGRRVEAFHGDSMRFTSEL